MPSCAVLRACLVLTHRLCLVHFLAPSQDGETAFHKVARSDECPTAVVLALLAAGADRTAKNKVSAMNNKGLC